MIEILKLKSQRHKFQSERAYKKRMQRLANKHGIVVEFCKGGTEFWVSPEVNEIMQKNAEAQGKIVEDIFLENASGNPTLSIEFY